MGWAGSLLGVALAACGGGDAGTGKKSGSQTEQDGGMQGRDLNVGERPDDDDDSSHGSVGLGDAGVRVASCDDAEDGSPCGPNGGLLCIDHACVATSCGDGVLDLAVEECDDENTISGDGCDGSCTFSCEDDAMCDDGVTCNGQERCLVDHRCEAGVPAQAGTACTSDQVGDGECRMGDCVPAGCGDERPQGDEQCDDGNATSGDGCELNCTFSCEEDAHCDDGNPCTGIERCDLASHTCAPGEALVCRDSSDCTHDECDPQRGCMFTLIDEDHDGHPPDSLECGDDCDDRNSEVHPGHAELCDDVDNDCNPDNDQAQNEIPTWYADCDGDGYASGNAERVQSCELPEPSDCGGSWTTRMPASSDEGSVDCDDLEPNAFPMQSGWFTSERKNGGYDYDCDGIDELNWTATEVSERALCLGIIGGDPDNGCGGVEGWIDSKAPDCGTSASFTRCVGLAGPLGGSCQRVVFEETQSCR